MKTKLIVMSLILTVSSALYAGACEHDKAHKGEGHKGKQFRQNRLSDLNLTESQQVSFDAIMKNQKESMKAAMELIHSDAKVELSKILSAEQMQLLEEKNDNRKSKRHMKKRMENRSEKTKNQEEN